MFGKLSWDAIPTTEPIVMYTLAVVGLIGVALVGSITYISGSSGPVSYCTAGTSTNGCLPAITADAPSIHGSTDNARSPTVFNCTRLFTS